eukprot:8262247-Ditylum_brightwellii.AAC.1
MCSAILEAIWDCLNLCGTYLLFHKLLQVNSCIGLGSSVHLISADFSCSEGVQQGTVEASFLFYMGTNKANQVTHRDLLQTGGGLMAGMDDIYMLDNLMLSSPLYLPIETE